MSQAITRANYLCENSLKGSQHQTLVTGPAIYICPSHQNGNPLQCSCLENPRDGGAWRAAVSGVAQSRTRLKRHLAAAVITERATNNVRGRRENQEISILLFTVSATLSNVLLSLHFSIYVVLSHFSHV